MKQYFVAAQLHTAGYIHLLRPADTYCCYILLQEVGINEKDMYNETGIVEEIIKLLTDEEAGCQAPGTYPGTRTVMNEP